MDNEKQFKSIKSNLKGLVLSEKNGYTEKKLWGHYMEFIGQDLEKESRNLGFSSMAAFLGSMGDIMRKGFNLEGEEVYKGVPDESTRHMFQLIGKTPAKQKKRRGMRGRARGRGLSGGMRGRGGFRGRGNIGPIGGGRAGFRGRGGTVGRGGRNGYGRYANNARSVFDRLGVLGSGSENMETMGGVQMRSGGSGSMGGQGGRNGYSTTARSVAASSFPVHTPYSSHTNKPSSANAVKPNIVVGSFSAKKISQDNYFKNILDQHFIKNNCGSVPFVVSSEGKRFMAGVRVSGKCFGTYPQSFGSEAEAVEAVSKKCVQGLNIISITPVNENIQKDESLIMPVNKNILKDESLMKESSDTVMIANRIKLLIAGKKDGIYSTIIEKQYEKKYREKLPSQWWEEIMSVVQVEPLSAGSNVMIIFPNPLLDESKLNLSIKEEQKMTDNRQEVEGEKKIFDKLPRLRLPNDELWDVYITCVSWAGEVYIRFIGDEYSEKFNEVSEGMENFYSDPDIPGVEEVVVGRVYAAMADDGWHRVEVTQFQDPTAVGWFLDCGDQDIFDRKDLQELDTRFLSVPAQAVQVSLHGLGDVKDESVMERVVGKSLIAQVMFAGNNEEIPSVILFDTSDQEVDVNINQKIIEERQVSVGNEDDNDPKTEENLSDSPTDTNEKRQENAMSTKKKALRPLPIMQIPAVNTDFDVEVVWSASPSSFVVQAINFSKQLKDLMSDLEIFYNISSNRIKILDDVTVGEYFAALHDDERWYRVKVVREIDLNLLVVRFVDYGENVITSLEKLQPLADEFRELPMQGIMAKLADGSKPRGESGFSVWTQEDIGWFNRRVVGQQFVSRVRGATEAVSGEMMMELVLIDTSHPDVDQYVAKQLLDKN